MKKTHAFLLLIAGMSLAIAASFRAAETSSGILDAAPGASSFSNGDAFANFCMGVWSVATRFGRASSEQARDYALARQATALAEADHRHPAGIKALYV